MALTVEYRDKEYTLDLEEMTLEEGRAMERHGVPNLRALEEGIAAGDVAALSVAFWIMLRQSGQPDQRIDRLEGAGFLPIKFVKALIRATQDQAPEGDGEGNAEG